VHLFHYHLVTKKVRQVEARYVGKLGFDLVARYGRLGDDLAAFESGVSWEELDERGFKLRLAELERGSVNIVVQPGQWELPRVDHLGIALDDDDFEATLARANQLELRIQDHGGRRTFVSTHGGFRLEVHPPRDWLDQVLAAQVDFRVAELHLLADDPLQKAAALGEVLGIEPEGESVELGEARVRFLPGGPQGRPQLDAELFL
jgi:catechol 2,3-dioxygenase-like lactoylglutathione lyase family enzyme